MINKHDIIENARNMFDTELHTEAYHLVHSDSEHLDSLLNLISAEKGKRYLDIGTGNGYVAFELSQRNPDIFVMGLDIAEKATIKNQEIVKGKKIKNLDFLSYQGADLPIADNSIFGIVSRYAIHHFPDFDFSIKEFVRILEPNSMVIISDPVTVDEDTTGFIDRFQNLKKDGHVHFYYEKELIDMFTASGFEEVNSFYSSVSYERELNSEYHDLLTATSQAVLDKYQIDVSENKASITVKVFNIAFTKMGV